MTQRRIHGLAAAVVAVGVLAFVGGATGANENSWTDPAGDSGNAADLTQIVVQSDDAGTITFHFTYANRPAGLGDNDRVQIYLDTDENASTGLDGYDYGIGLIKGDAVLKRWSGTEFVDTPHTTFSATPDGRSATVNRRELGETAKVAFFLRSDLVSDTDRSTDEAPDASNEVFVYWVVGPSPEHILTVTSPKTPKAGAKFTVAVPLVQLENGASVVPEKLTCKATLNGRPLAARATAISCAWRLPTSARGKRLVVTITVTNNGATTTFSRPYKIR